MKTIKGLLAILRTSNSYYKAHIYCYCESCKEVTILYTDVAYDKQNLCPNVVDKNGQNLAQFLCCHYKHDYRFGPRPKSYNIQLINPKI